MKKETAMKMLKLEKGFTKQDLKSSYRKLSKVYHPDMETGNEEFFQLLTEAKDLLSKDESVTKEESKASKVTKRWQKVNELKDKPRYMAKGTLFNIVDLG